MIRFSVITHQMLLYCRLFCILLKWYYYIYEDLFLLFFYKLTPPWLWKYSASKPCYSRRVTPSPACTYFLFLSPTFYLFHTTGVLRCRRPKLRLAWKSMTSASGSTPSCEMSSTLPVVRNLKHAQVQCRCVNRFSLYKQDEGGRVLIEMHGTTLFCPSFENHLHVSAPKVQQGLMFWYPENVLHHLRTSLSSSLCVIPLSVIFGVSTVTVR